jgi:hypothetical protein
MCGSLATIRYRVRVTAASFLEEFNLLPALDGPWRRMRVAVRDLGNNAERVSDLRSPIRFIFDLGAFEIRQSFPDSLIFDLSSSGESLMWSAVNAKSCRCLCMGFARLWSTSLSSTEARMTTDCADGSVYLRTGRPCVWIRSSVNAREQRESSRSTNGKVARKILKSVVWPRCRAARSSAARLDRILKPDAKVHGPGRSTAKHRHADHATSQGECFSGHRVIIQDDLDSGVDACGVAREQTGRSANDGA